MRAVVKLNGASATYEAKCEVTRDGNKLIIEFDKVFGHTDIVPYPVIDHLGKDGVTFQFVKDDKEPECGDCNKCLTPIC